MHLAVMINFLRKFMFVVSGFFTILINYGSIKDVSARSSLLLKTLPNFLVGFLRCPFFSILHAVHRAPKMFRVLLPARVFSDACFIYLNLHIHILWLALYV